MHDVTIVDDQENLIQEIIKRDSKIKLSQQELVIQWIQQGLNMLKLYENHKCTQKNISERTGVSVGSVNKYITLASDIRLISFIFSDEYNNTGSKQIERFNQKELIKLTTLNNVDFNSTIESGKFPKSEKEDKSIKLSDEDILKNKGEQVEQLLVEMKDIEVKIDAEVIDVEIVPHLVEDNRSKSVEQIDLTTGEILATYKSVSVVAKLLNYSQANLSNCCNGKRKTAYGFKWRFAE